MMQPARQLSKGRPSQRGLHAHKSHRVHLGAPPQAQRRVGPHRTNLLITMAATEAKEVQAPKAKAGPSVATPAEQELGLLESTALKGAAYRALDMETAARPLIDDPLARVLAGAESSPRFRDMLVQSQQESVRQGRPGGNNYWVARAYLVDRDIEHQLAVLRERFPAASRLQVVNMGAGMCTRPWRLPLPPGVAWFELDQPRVMHCKDQMLRAANAQASGGADQGRPSSLFQFPLKCDSYHMVGCTLSATDEGGSLRAALTSAGDGQFDASLPTLWCMEGLSYYLDTETLSKVLTDMAALSPAGSVAVITTYSKLMSEMWCEKLAVYYKLTGTDKPPKGSLWFYNSMEDWVTGGGLSPSSPSLLHDLGWRVDNLSPDYAQHLPQVAPGRFALPAWPVVFFGDKYNLTTMSVEHTVTITHM